MDIENSNEKESRFGRIKKRSTNGSDAEREVLGSLDDDKPAANENSIKLYSEPAEMDKIIDKNYLSCTTSVPSMPRGYPKHIQTAAKDSHHIFVKNQIYYGQSSYNPTEDYRSVQPTVAEAKKNGNSQSAQEIRDFRKERKLKRKNKSNINNFESIKMDTCIEETEGSKYQSNAQSKKEAEMELKSSQQPPQKLQGKSRNFFTQSDSIEYESQSVVKGSLHSSNHILLRLNSLIQPPKEQSNTPEREYPRDQQEYPQFGINSISVLLGVHHEISSLKTMMYCSLPKNSLMRCYIKRVSTFNLTLELYLDDQRFLMKSVTQNAAIGCNHYISLSKEVNKNMESYLGKLRSDFLGSIYTLYDCGVSQKQAKNGSLQMRTSMANIEYQNNILGMKGPRKIKVTIPDPRVQQRDIFKIKDKQTLSSILGQHPHSLIILQNKKPVWNQKLKTYALNFGGRVKMPSIKNFMLETSSGQSVMTFGKVDTDTFTLEFRYPLSPFQAFGIGMSSFDFKLNCQ